MSYSVRAPLCITEINIHFTFKQTFPIPQKIKLGLPKVTALKTRFRCLLEVVYFSKAAATDCRSLYKQCLCPIQRRKWMLNLVLCSPLISGSDWLHLILHTVSILPWSEIYQWYLSFESQPPAPQTSSLFSCLCRSNQTTVPRTVVSVTHTQTKISFSSC